MDKKIKVGSKVWRAQRDAGVARRLKNGGDPLPSGFIYVGTVPDNITDMDPHPVILSTKEYDPDHLYDPLGGTFTVAESGPYNINLLFRLHSSKVAKNISYAFDISNIETSESEYTITIENSRSVTRGGIKIVAISAPFPAVMLKAGVRYSIIAEQLSSQKYIEAAGRSILSVFKVR